MEYKKLLAELSIANSYNTKNKSFNDWWKQTLNIIENDIGHNEADELYDKEDDLQFILTLLYLYQKGKISKDELLEEIGDFEVNNESFNAFL